MNLHLLSRLDVYAAISKTCALPLPPTDAVQWHSELRNTLKKQKAL